VVDDETKILEVIKSYLEKEGYTALCAEDGNNALRLFRQYPVSLVLLDLMLPDLSGETICRKIRSQSDVPIIMITAKVEEEHIIHGLSLGADDYVTKPFRPRQLIARVAAVLRRYGVTDNGIEGKGGKVYTSGVLTVDTENRRVIKAGAVVKLTPNEYKMLALLISRPHKIFTRDEIIDIVKTDDFDGFDRTIDTHISNLRQKIEDDTRSPRYVVTVYGMGYRFGNETP
jgi:DNA-binding response OmpR family regulator